MDRRALARKIKSLDALSADEKSELLSLLRAPERYGLVWEERSEAVERRLRRGVPVLGEVLSKAVAAPVFDAPEHMLIEADNLEALTALARTHEGEIDVIYIDPPYNTGNKDFIYNDSFVDEADTFRHSKWLSFMARRLRLARRLLSDDGVIFISVDDNEQAGVKLLCDDIFGSSNFITVFHWEKTQHFGRQKVNFYSNCEYVLCYAKQLNDGHIKELLVERINSELADAPLYNASNNEKELHFPAGSVRFGIKDGLYTSTTSADYTLAAPVTVSGGVNADILKLRFRSRWSQQTVNAEHAKGTTFMIKSGKFAIRTLYHQGKTSKEAPRSLIFTNAKNPLCTKNRFGMKAGVNENASAELREILGGNIFDYPKPVSLIAYLLSLYFDERRQRHADDFTILDFFAGSGTTLHAAMLLNEADGGKRRCILVTDNQNGICEKVTYERCRRVICGYETPRGRKVKGLKNNTLRYYRIRIDGAEGANDDH